MLKRMLQIRFIVVFDAHCKLCNAAVRYIIRHDPAGTVRFAAMQGDTGRQLIERHRGPDFDYGTLLFIRDGCCYERGEAMLEIFRILPRCRIQFRLFQLIPPPARNAVYTLVARNRYRLFGRQKDGTLPDEPIHSRFLE